MGMQGVEKRVKFTLMIKGKDRGRRGGEGGVYIYIYIPR